MLDHFIDWYSLFEKDVSSLLGFLAQQHFSLFFYEVESNNLAIPVNSRN